MTGKTRLLMSLIYAAFVVYVFVPLTMMIVMGFKDSKFIGFPIKSWTLDWYARVFQDTEVMSVFGYSVPTAWLITGALFLLAARLRSVTLTMVAGMMLFFTSYFVPMMTGG